MLMCLESQQAVIKDVIKSSIITGLHDDLRLFSSEIIMPISMSSKSIQIKGVISVRKNDCILFL